MWCRIQSNLSQPLTVDKESKALDVVVNEFANEIQSIAIMSDGVIDDDVLKDRLSIQKDFTEKLLQQFKPTVSEGEAYNKGYEDGANAAANDIISK